jgi:hypothetical protein
VDANEIKRNALHGTTNRASSRRVLSRGGRLS